MAFDLGPGAFFTAGGSIGCGCCGGTMPTTVDCHCCPGGMPLNYLVVMGGWTDDVNCTNCDNMNRSYAYTFVGDTGLICVWTSDAIPFINCPLEADSFSQIVFDCETCYVDFIFAGLRGVGTVDVLTYKYWAAGGFPCLSGTTIMVFQVSDPDPYYVPLGVTVYDFRTGGWCNVPSTITVQAA